MYALRLFDADARALSRASVSRLAVSANKKRAHRTSHAGRADATDPPLTPFLPRDNARRAP